MRATRRSGRGKSPMSLSASVGRLSCVWRANAPLRSRLVVLAALLLTAAACNYEKVHKQPTIEEAPRLASTVHMGDATAAAQLISGFHDIEGGSWRWTDRKSTRLNSSHLGIS